MGPDFNNNGSFDVYDAGVIKAIQENRVPSGGGGGDYSCLGCGVTGCFVVFTIIGICVILLAFIILMCVA